MTGTTDILMIFDNGHKLSMSPNNLDEVNRWLDDNRDKLRAMHVGRTKTIFREGRAIAQVECSRGQVLEGL